MFSNYLDHDHIQNNEIQNNEIQNNEIQNNEIQNQDMNDILSTYHTLLDHSNDMIQFDTPPSFSSTTTTTRIQEEEPITSLISLSSSSSTSSPTTSIFAQNEELLPLSSPIWRIPRQRNTSVAFSRWERRRRRTVNTTMSHSSHSSPSSHSLDVENIPNNEDQQANLSSLLSPMVTTILEDQSDRSFRGSRFEMLLPCQKDWYLTMLPHMTTFLCPICREFHIDRVLICSHGHSLCRTCFEIQKRTTHILEKVCCLCRKPWVSSQGIPLREWKSFFSDIFSHVQHYFPWKVGNQIDVCIHSFHNQWFPATITSIDWEVETCTLLIGQKWNVVHNLFSDSLQPLHTHTSSWSSYIQTKETELLSTHSSLPPLLHLTGEYMFSFDYFLSSSSKQWVCATMMCYDTIGSKWFFICRDSSLPPSQQHQVLSMTTQEFINKEFSQFSFFHTFSWIDQESPCS